jgi:hypothetical protein
VICPLLLMVLCGAIFTYSPYGKDYSLYPQVSRTLASVAVQ